VTGTASRDRDLDDDDDDDEDDVSSMGTTLHGPGSTVVTSVTRRRRGGVGCMAIVEGVLTGIDRAERALLGSLSIDDDLWDDLHEEDYDLYSTEMTANGEEDDNDDDGGTTPSVTARRSGLTTSTLGSKSSMSNASSAPAPRRSPRRSQYYHRHDWA
jgi:hypothetical protein